MFSKIRTVERSLQRKLNTVNRKHNTCPDRYYGVFFFYDSRQGKPIISHGCFDRSNAPIIYYPGPQSPASTQKWRWTKEDYLDVLKELVTANPPESPVHSPARGFAAPWLVVHHGRGGRVEEDGIPYGREGWKISMHVPWNVRKACQQTNNTVLLRPPHCVVHKSS